jgi:signal transduction histidine kinase
MRTMLLELRPSSLTERELGSLLRQLADAMMGRTRIPVTVAVQGEQALTDDVQIGLYRIAQEALNNIVKHARASHAHVSLECEAGQVALSIRDDGRGFDPSGGEPHQLGLSIMRERARAIGAKLVLESEPESGTQITITWPASGQD